MPKGRYFPNAPKWLQFISVYSDAKNISPERNCRYFIVLVIVKPQKDIFQSCDIIVLPFTFYNSQYTWLSEKKIDLEHGEGGERWRNSFFVGITREICC